MIEILDIENVKFGSVNNKYDKNFHLVPAYKNFKELIFWNLLRVKINPLYKIKITTQMYIDIDNPIKPIFDAIQAKGIIDNDKNIVDLQIIKIPIKKGSPGSINIKIMGDCPVSDAIKP